MRIMLTYKEFYDDLSEDYPVGWNQTEFESINSFSGKMRYAASHLRRMASGSGRVAFDIDGKKVLKLAKNKKGLAQNSVEVEGYLQNYDIVARVFDHGDDVQNIGPYWLVMEFARKLSRKRFETLTGITLDNLYWYLLEIEVQRGGRRHYAEMPPSLKNKMDNNEFVIDLISLNADYDMATGDQSRLSTWGEVLRDGKPTVVLIDFGLTKNVAHEFYGRKQPYEQ